MISKLPLKKRLRISIGDIVEKVKLPIRNTNGGFRVLLYHSVTEKLVENEWEENTTPKELFAKQMKYLIENGYKIVSCKEAVDCLAKKKKIPDKTVAIAFDDGYRDNCVNAFPILKKYNIHSTIFLTVDFLYSHPKNTQYINYAEIVNIKKSGLVDFGCHSITHRILSTLDEEELNGEIAGAKQKLEDLTESKIALFAYPFGHSASYNTNVIEKIESAGFIGAFTTIFGLNDFRRNHFLLRRNRISWIDGLDEFEKHLNGSYDWCSLFECFRFKRYR